LNQLKNWARMKLPFEKIRQLRLGLSGAVRAPSENKTSSKKN